MSTRLVVLDMAGTTVSDNDSVAIAFQKAFAKYGYNVSFNEVRPLMGYKKTLAIEKVLQSKNANVTLGLISKIHNDFVDEMVDHYQTSPEVKPATNAEEMLVWLKEKGIRVAMNTGFPRQIADVIVDRFQWVEKKLVDEYIASDEVEQGRPHPLMIQRLMQSARITDPNEVVKVGDTEVDINEGRNAKCGIVVAITTGAFTRHQLEPYHPDHIIDNLKELQNIIR